MSQNNNNSNNNNLSVEEILREAQEVLSSIDGGAKEHKDDPDDVKTFEPRRKQRMKRTKAAEVRKGKKSR